MNIKRVAEFKISEEGIRPQIGEVRLCNHRTIQKGQENVVFTILLYKTKDKSNLIFFGRGPHKADPKKMEETTTQGSDFLVESSEICKNHTHLYTENFTSQHNHLLKKIKAQTKGGLIITFQLYTWTKSLSNDQISWIHHVGSRSPTELTEAIIKCNRLITASTVVIRPEHLNILLFCISQTVVVVLRSEPASKDTTSEVQAAEEIACHFRETQGFERNTNMGATAREKGKSPMARSVENIVFCTEMAALDFEPTREEETFLQLIGLDRFITRVTWEILNVQVIQEVIAHLDIDTMETKLTGRVIPIFGKGWRQKLKAVFYLQNFTAKREPGTLRVRATDIFPNINDKMKNKLGSCRITDCTIPEARKPFKFFNSLFLLRTNANTIACTAVVHIQDALNGKEVDWPELFYNYLKMELITLKEELYKNKTTTLRTLVGPPLTMLLISEGWLTVQQELEAGILLPPEIVEAPPAKKRKYEDDTIGIVGETSTKPQILTALAEPIRTALSTATDVPNEDIHTSELKAILDSYHNASHRFGEWIAHANNDGRAIS
jgi:hypothetical protein